MDQLPLPSPPAPAAQAPAPATAAPLEPVSTTRLQRLARLWGPLALVAVLVVAGIGWVSYADLARNVQALQAQVAAARNDAVAEAAHATRIAREVEARTEDLIRELDQVKAQRAALDQLYLELARGRDEATLLDVERLITLAAQDVRFTGHVAGALNALQAADARLARMDRPQYVGLRRALARDIERLRGVPVVDVTGIALKLDQVAASIDSLPMLSDPATKPARTPAAAAPAAPPAKETLWDKIRGWIGDEFGDLVRIREIDTPDALLLSNAQQQLVRSQFRLRLLDARQALIARNERVFRADLNEAQSLLTRYFDVKGAAGGAALLQLRQLGQSTLAVDVPGLDESLAAIRSTRPAAAPLPTR
jgi:uroporphyrin-3 C-methyltransferase/uroporphyrinogen III methyltransferase/synthase